MKVLRNIAIIALAAVSLLPAQGKRALGHEDFDAWKSVRNYTLSRDGNWAAFAVNPQEGDGTLTLLNTANGKRIEIARGYNPTFTADGRWAVALVKPLFSDTRKAKILKKKDHEMPQDSLAIISLRDMSVKKVGNVKGYKMASEAGDWIAFTSTDTTYIKPKFLSDKDCGRPLVVADLVSGNSKIVKWVKDYTFSENGKRLAFNVKKPEKDSLATDGIGVMLLPDTSYIMIDRDKRHYGAPVLDREGNRLAYVASDDSVKTGTRDSQVYLSDLRSEMRSPKLVDLHFKDAKGQTLRPNQYTKPKFSWNGRRLIAGVAPVIAPDDTTIVDFEKGKLDIWVWDRALTPPREQSLLDEIKKMNYPVAVDVENFSATLLADDMLAEVKAPNRWDGNEALVLAPSTESQRAYQWDYFYPTPMHLVNLNTGKRTEVGKYLGEMPPELSPCDRYVAWFSDRTWWVYDIETGKTIDVGANVPEALWDTDDRHPSPSSPWGIAGWSANDEHLLVYDRHDIWQLDPKGVKAPVCLTKGEGRKRGVRFRYYNTDPKHRRNLSKGDLMLLKVFDYTDKYYGLATMRYGAPVQPAMQVLDGHAYTQIRQARNAETFTWERANFSELPDIWLSRGIRFANAKKVTDANPQIKDYYWGTAQLERWNAYDGNPSEGVLYVPENLDPNKKYPMLCVFYETGSEDLYSHYEMEPSWSWVNYPFYVSRGYVVFVPDIHYTSGRPGEDAYNYVCSGAEEMCRRYPWIDKERIGIDGQSWGGYQTAYLVTRTNMFACAGSGAPVANMTSAYGGIRWESGDSRQAQYEVGQSRIGGTLWDMKDQYVANSPVFHADRVETPLLIMHNDNDGAVPWYQGIEMFMALRRLQKPVWMLQYNGESHNIRKRGNRKDITIRLQQFFDHYLKGDPMPKWMKEGVPMIRKGQEFGFELE